MTDVSVAVRELLDKYQAAQTEIERLRDALERARTTMRNMADFAFQVGLEGTTEWDKIAGAAGLHGAIDEAAAALD